MMKQYFRFVFFSILISIFWYVKDAERGILEENHFIFRSLLALHYVGIKQGEPPTFNPSLSLFNRIVLISRTKYMDHISICPSLHSVIQQIGHHLTRKHIIDEEEESHSWKYSQNDNES